MFDFTFLGGRLFSPADGGSGALVTLNFPLQLGILHKCSYAVIIIYGTYVICVTSAEYLYCLPKQSL